MSSIKREDLLAKAEDLINEALHFANQGYYSKAEPCFLQVLQLKEQALGPHHPEIAKGLRQLACIYQEQDHRISEVEALLIKALKVLEAAALEDDSELLDNIHHLAFFYFDQGRLQEAELLFLRALAIAEPRLKYNHYPVAYSLNYLAYCYQAQGRLGEAEMTYLKALSIAQRVFKLVDLSLWNPVAGEDLSALIIVRQNLATLYKDLGDAGKAEIFLVQALLTQSQAYGPEDPGIGFSLYELALLSQTNGISVKAELLMKWACRILERSLGAEHNTVCECLAALAAILAANLKYVEAYDTLVKALKIKLANIGLEFANRDAESRTLHSDDFQDLVFQFYSLAFKLIELKPEIAQEAFTIALKSKNTLTDAFITARKEILSGHYPHMTDAFAKRRDLAERIVLLTLRGPDEYSTLRQHNALLAKCKFELTELELSLSKAIPEFKLKQWQDQVTTDILKSNLRKNETFIEFVKYCRYDFLGMKKGENPWQEWRYLAFVLTNQHSNPVRLVDLGDASVIDQEVQNYSVGIGRFASHTAGQSKYSGRIVPENVSDDLAEVSKPEDAGVRLRELLIDPLLVGLNPVDEGFGFEENPCLIISADGELPRLSFGALPLGQPDAYLLDRYQVRYLESGRDLVAFSKGPAAKVCPPLVLADPDFDLRPGKDGLVGQADNINHLINVAVTQPTPENAGTWRQSRDLGARALKFSRLPGTRIEAGLISGYLSTIAWVDDHALEGRLKRQTSPIVLHIATHGFFFPNQPMALKERWGFYVDPSRLDRHLGQMENPMLRSGLALSGAHHSMDTSAPIHPEIEDGLLTAADVAEMDLLATELVVLSACQSGLGDVEIGQGVMGLRTAFRVAGAKTLVASLWEVNDLATCILMDRFYCNLVKEFLPRDAALSAAMQHLRHLTVDEMQETWLNPVMRDLFVNANPAHASWYDNFLSLPKDAQPFQSPYYWAAFIIIGKTEPMLTFKATAS